MRRCSGPFFLIRKEKAEFRRGRVGVLTNTIHMVGIPLDTVNGPKLSNSYKTNGSVREYSSEFSLPTSLQMLTLCLSSNVESRSAM